MRKQRKAEDQLMSFNPPVVIQMRKQIAQNDTS